MTETPSSEGAVLLDTDAFSFLHKAGPRAQEFRPKIEGRLPLLSFVSVGELLRGALQNGWGEQRRTQLQARIDAMTVIPFDEIVISLYAETTAWAVAHGHPLGHAEQSNDAWIAATARAHGVPLLTGNRRHFDGCAGLTLM